MGNSLRTLFSPSKQNILFAGLDGVGKSTILYSLDYLAIQIKIPTLGVHTEELFYKGFLLSINEMGVVPLQFKRILWKSQNFDALIYVFDISNQEIFTESFEDFRNLLKVEEFNTFPILVLVNKMDRCNVNFDEFCQKIKEIEELNSHQWNILPSCAIKKEGIEEGLEWLKIALKIEKNK